MGAEPNGLIAVFPTRETAERGVEWLVADGIERRDVSILGPRDSMAPGEVPAELDHSAGRDRAVASYWAKWGAMLGGTAVVGPVSIALAASAVGLGPLAITLAAGGAVLAAAAGVGALTAGLVAAGVHHQHAVAYEKALAAGKFLIVVHSDRIELLDETHGALTRLGAETVDVHASR
jgi:hypothetical protein